MTDVDPRLLADGMLGRLAKWLRLLGYDTDYDNAASDAELARRARAEGRVLLTRDHELASRRGLETVLIESERLEGQVHEIRNALGPPPEPALSRCATCNEPLEPIAKDDVVDRVPPYVHTTQTEFHRCPKCRRIYWPGTHYEAMRAQIQSFDIKDFDDV